VGRIRYEPAAAIFHYELGFAGMDRRQMDRVRVVNRAYLFRKNFPQTRRAKARFAVLMAMLCVHRVLNREWSGLRGLLGGMREVHSTRSPGAHLSPGAALLQPLGSVRLVSTVQIFDRAINLDGHAVRMGGIGSVFTVEEYRHKGVASALMRLAVDTMVREGFIGPHTRGLFVDAATIEELLERMFAERNLV